MIKNFLVIFPLLISSGIASANQQVESIVQRMTAEQKAAQLIIVYYTTPEFIIEHQFGGVLIMQNMLKKPDRIKQGLRKIQSELEIDTLVSIDQEGGRVNRMKYLSGWKNVPSAKSMGSWSEEKITSQATKMAVALKALGINLNLAPVLDPSLDQLGVQAFMSKNKRSFGDGTEQIVPKAEAFIDGFRSQNIGSVSKHFPGYDVQSNSDHEVAVSDASFEYVSENIKTFAQVSDNVIGVMISSVHYKQFTEAPAVMSSILVEMARTAHPNAILMTDDLWGKALRAWARDKGNVSKDQQVLALTRSALNAGNDMLMITYPEKAVLMIKNISSWMKADKVFERRVNNSVYKILINKEKLGLLTTSNTVDKKNQ